LQINYPTMLCSGHHMKQYKLSQLFSGIALICIFLAIFRRPILCIFKPASLHGLWHGFWAPWYWISWLIGCELDFGHELNECNVWATPTLFVGVVVQAVVLVILWVSIHLLFYYTLYGKLPDNKKTETKTMESGYE
jgi:hypothetical protein